MFAQYKTVPGPDDGKGRSPSSAAVDVDLIIKLERAAGAQRAREIDLERRRSAQLNYLVSFWPVGVGVLLAFVAPLLHDLVSPWQPWGMRLLFPFVVLAGVPETHLNNQASISLQHFLIYAQFPLEGLIARMAVRSRLSFSGVAGHLCFLHFLGAVDIWLLSGVLNQMTMR